MTRVGLVLGAGGTLGATWMIGALGAVQERIGRPLQDVDVIVGTSAGSILAAALRHGVTPDELVAHQRGESGPDLPDLHTLERESGRLPRPPRLRLGSPRLLATAVRTPHRVHPGVAASAWALHGRTEHGTLHRYVHALGRRHSVRHGSWPARRTWIVAVDYDSGRRVTFGRDGAPRAPLPDAVVASCSIPGWHSPKAIGDRRYVDGGVRSVTSVDLLHRERLDHVYVLAPMASHESDYPLHPVTRAERFVRQMVAMAVEREVHKVRAAGTDVTVVMPGRADLTAIGANLMDGRRRARVLDTSLQTVAGHLSGGTVGR